MAADSGALAMVDVATPAATTDVDIPSLDEATPNASETPTVEETPAEEKSGAEIKTEDGKPAAEKSAAAEASTPITPKQINAQLQELKKSNEPLAKAIHSHVKQSLSSARFLQEVGAKDFAEAKTLLSKPDEVTENFRQSVEQTDEMLYRGDLKELTSNILADVEAELGDAAPARLSELSEALLEKIAEADPEGSTRIQRAQFLAASEASGLITSLNKLNAFIASGDTKSAAALLKNIGAFFSEELKAAHGVTAAKATAKAAAEKETTATVTKLRAESETAVNKSMTTILGGFLSPFLKGQLKGVSRADLNTLAGTIMSEAKSALGKDAEYVKEISKLYSNMRTAAQKDKLMQRFESALKKDDFGKRLVERVCKERFPERFTVKPAAPKTPTTAQVTIGGKPQTVFQMEKRPTNLVRSDVEVAGRTYTAQDLQLLQIKGIGLVPNKSGKGHSFVQWKR